MRRTKEQILGEELAQKRLAHLNQVWSELILMRSEMMREGYKLWCELPWLRNRAL